MKNSCLGCKNRYVGCHSNCELYTTYKNNIELAKKEKEEALNFENYKLDKYIKNAIDNHRYSYSKRCKLMKNAY